MPLSFTVPLSAELHKHNSGDVIVVTKAIRHKIKK